MGKAIIILSGSPHGKNRMKDWLEANGYKDKVAHINFTNVITKAFRDYFYWDGEKNSDYFLALKEIEEILNKRFDSAYLHAKIILTAYKEKVGDRLLILHRINKEPRLIDLDGAFTVHIARVPQEFAELTGDNPREKYDKVLLDGPNFDSELENLMFVLLEKNKEKEN
jgi:hypothetical protein